MILVCFSKAHLGTVFCFSFRWHQSAQVQWISKKKRRKLENIICVC